MAFSIRIESIPVSIPLLVVFKVSMVNETHCTGCKPHAHCPPEQEACQPLENGGIENMEQRNGQVDFILEWLFDCSPLNRFLWRCCWIVKCAHCWIGFEHRRIGHFSQGLIELFQSWISQFTHAFAGLWWNECGKTRLVRLGIGENTERPSVLGATRLGQQGDEQAHEQRRHELQCSHAHVMMDTGDLEQNCYFGKMIIESNLLFFDSLCWWCDQLPSSKSATFVEQCSDRIECTVGTRWNEDRSQPKWKRIEGNQKFGKTFFEERIKSMKMLAN